MNKTIIYQLETSYSLDRDINRLDSIKDQLNELDENFEIDIVYEPKIIIKIGLLTIIYDNSESINYYSEQNHISSYRIKQNMFRSDRTKEFIHDLINHLDLIQNYSNISDI
jgi:hypothetical protein